MGAAIWYYPDPKGTVEEIDLGECLSDLEETPQRDQIVSQAITGAVTTVHLSSREQYRIERSRIKFGSADLAARLHAFRNHLQRGGHFSLAEDKNRAVGGFLTVNPDRVPNGTQVVELIRNTWPYNPAAALQPNDYVRLQSPSPIRYAELVTSDAFDSANPAPFSIEGVKYRYVDERWTLLTHRGFYPCLRLPPDQRNQPIFTHDHRITWTLDFIAETDPSLLDIFATADQAVGTDQQTFNTLDSPPLIFGRQEANPPPRVWTAPR